MAGPTPKLALPKDERATAFRAFVDVLKCDPALRRVGVLWRTPDDTNFDDDPPKAGVFIRLNPKLLPMTPMALLGGGVRSFEAPVQVDCEMRAPSHVWDDTPNLAGLLVAAVSPSGSNSTIAGPKLEAGGISVVTPTTMPDDYGVDVIVTATFVLTCYITV
jgi:hypothetical protein